MPELNMTTIAVAPIPTPSFTIDRSNRPANHQSTEPSQSRSRTSSKTFWLVLALIVTVLAIYLPLALNSVPSTNKFPTESCPSTSNKAIQCRGTGGARCCSVRLTHDIEDPVHCNFDSSECFMTMFGDAALYTYYTLMFGCVALSFVLFYGSRLVCIGSLVRPEPSVNHAGSRSAVRAPLAQPLIEEEMKEQSVFIDAD